jgi:hypothetical protein
MEPPELPVYARETLEVTARRSPTGWVVRFLRWAPGKRRKLLDVNGLWHSQRQAWTHWDPSSTSLVGPEAMAAVRKWLAGQATKGVANAKPHR